MGCSRMAARHPPQAISSFALMQQKSVPLFTYQRYKLSKLFVKKPLIYRQFTSKSEKIFLGFLLATHHNNLSCSDGFDNLKLTKHSYGCINF